MEHIMKVIGKKIWYMDLVYLIIKMEKVIYFCLFIFSKW